MVSVGKGKHIFVIVQHFCPILTQYAPIFAVKQGFISLFPRIVVPL